MNGYTASTRNRTDVWRPRVAYEPYEKSASSTAHASRLAGPGRSFSWVNGVRRPSNIAMSGETTMRRRCWYEVVSDSVECSDPQSWRTFQMLHGSAPMTASGSSTQTCRIQRG